jgi:hypothetical protein
LGEDWGHSSPPLVMPPLVMLEASAVQARCNPTIPCLRGKPRADWKPRKSSSLQDDKREGVGSECESHPLTHSPLWIACSSTTALGRVRWHKACGDAPATQSGSRTTRNPKQHPIDATSSCWKHPLFKPRAFEGCLVGIGGTNSRCFQHDHLGLGKKRKVCLRLFDPPEPLLLYYGERSVECRVG